MNVPVYKKHAYLIMAHNNFEQLQILLSLIDDARNDIYLHIDKKVSDFPREALTVKHAGLFLVDPIVVSWGGDSQIKCEMLLFKNAAPKHYMYYHILSGVDLPLKTQDEIHAFFNKHAGKNFIAYDCEETQKAGTFHDRVEHYYLMQNIVGRNSSRYMQILRIVEGQSVRLQAKLGLKRKKIVPLYKGANWVSITDEMVQHILKCEKIIKKQFYHSICADEIFLQSIAMSSPYCDTIVNNYYRAIDWERGMPYTYRKEDVSQLIHSPNFFGRKFDSKVDEQAIRLVVEHLSKSKEENHN